jgi:hypothetical protein
MRIRSKDLLNKTFNGITDHDRHIDDDDDDDDDDDVISYHSPPRKKHKEAQNSAKDTGGKRRFHLESFQSLSSLCSSRKETH